MIRLETVILIQLIMGILLMVLLLKINAMKKQMEQIIKEVTDYVSYITAEEVVEEEEKNPLPSGKKTRKRSIPKDEAQSQLIQTVLQEYFP